MGKEDARKVIVTCCEEHIKFEIIGEQRKASFSIPKKRMNVKDFLWAIENLCVAVNVELVIVRTPNGKS